MSKCTERNLLVANAEGLNAGLCKTLDRMAARRDCPRWLIDRLEDYIGRSEKTIRVAVAWREELSQPKEREVTRPKAAKGKQGRRGRKR